MKYTPLLAAMLLATSASAEIVTSTGFGLTFDSALNNAKSEALEMGASTFVTGQKLYKNKQLSEEIVQYNGGIIKEYDIIRSYKIGDEYSVTIKADVEEQDNRRQANVGKKIYLAEHDKRQDVVDHLDDPGRAINMEIMDFANDIKSTGVNIRARVRLKWQPKWISDARSFSKVINEKGRTSTNTVDQAVGNVTNFLLNVNPVGGVLFHEAFDPEPVKNIDSQMICFATDRKSSRVDCRNIGVDFTRFSADPVLVMIVGGRVVHKQYIAPHLFEKVYPGEYMQNRFLRNHKVTFHQPALVVYTEEVHDVYMDFTVPRSLLKDNTSVEVYLK